MRCRDADESLAAPLRALPPLTALLMVSLACGGARVPPPSYAGGPGGPTQPNVKIVALPAAVDETPIDLVIAPPPDEVTGVGHTAILTLSVRPRIAVEDSLLTLAVAGSATSPALSTGPEWRRTDPGRGLLEDVAVRQQAESNLGALTPGQAREVPVDVRFTTSGIGYLAAAVRSPAEGPARVSEATVLYFLVTPGTVYFSDHSVLDLRVQELTAGLRSEGLPEAEIEERVERLRRGGAQVDKAVEPPEEDPAPPSDDPDSYNSVTVEGTVLFTDILGGTHPVRFATVEIWDEEAGPDELVDTTSTNSGGDYSSTVDDNDGDGTGRDFYVVVNAQGATVSVEDFDNPGTVWSIDSLPAIADVVDGSTLSIDLTASNDQADANNVAFEVYESTNYLSRYLAVLGEPLPALVTMLYPRPSDGSFYSPGSHTVTTGGTDNHDWDNLHHEYGHHIQNLYNSSDSPGGAHSLGSNLCSLHGKDAGLRLSWGEAWPTFFGTMSHQELGLAGLGIPNLGDTSYTDTKPVGPALQYDLEPSTVFQGESDEVSAQRLMWDLYDAADDDGDDGVSLSAQELWDLVVDDESHKLSEFWNALIFLRGESEKASYGEIAQDHGIGTAPTAPADGSTFSGGAAPSFQWTENLECDNGGNGRFSLRAYNDSYSSLIWASPWQAAATLAPTDPQRDLVFAGPDAALRWLVASRDTTVPETGPYYGASRTINDDFDVPDRSPVDLILALDVSASMSSVVPGSDTALTKIDLLRQAVEIFLQTWRLHQVPGDRIGVIYLSSDTSSIPAAPPVLRDLATEVDAIIADVGGKAASGCTAVGGALQVGFDSFDPTSMNKRVLILFSDGMQSINPFVGEEGMPARLKIAQIPAVPLPFGAFFCSTETADDLTGADIVPDGQFVDEHSVQVHTIGVGVDGAGFQELIERIADETDGLHHFTSAPDENLDIFYTNDLVNSLKTATLEIVGTSSGTVSPQSAKTVLVPVNETAISLTLVVSWKGGQEVVGLSVRAPGGQPVGPTEAREGSFYRIWKIDLPPRVEGATVSSVGSWRVDLSGSRSALKYQLTAIVDEPCFHYRFDVPTTTVTAGDRVRLTTALTQNGQPVLNADGIFVEVERPAEPMGNLLAEWMPRTTSSRSTLEEPRAGSLRRSRYGRRPPIETDPAQRAFDGALAELYENPEFAARARSKTRHRVFLADDGSEEHGDARAGDGIYSGYLTATQIPGSYFLALTVQASSLCGRVARTESTSTLVTIDRFDPVKTVVTALPLDDGTYSVLVAPVDRFGNLLGPGWHRQVAVLGDGIQRLGGVRDRLDGSYEQRIAVAPGSNPRITVQVGGRQVSNPYFRDLEADGRRRYPARY